MSQGTDWKNAKVAVFLSVKLNSAQQNYAVDEIGVHWDRNNVTAPGHPAGSSISVDNG